MNIGIIGLGAIGQRLIPQFNVHSATHITAICDVDQTRIDETAANLPSVHTYTSYQDLLNDESVDLVYVAVPPKFHYPVVMDAVSANKHILCEKPFANSLEEADEMRQAVQGKSLIHALNFPMFYHNEYRFLKKALAQPAIGDVLQVEMTAHFPQWPRSWQINPWIAGREQGGMVREIMPHYIQLMNRLFGQVSVPYAHLDYPVDSTLCETSVVAHMQLQNGASVVLKGLCGLGDEELIRFRVIGSKGSIAIKNWSVLEISEGLRISDEDVHEYSLIDELVKAFHGQYAELVDFEEGYEVQRVLEQLLN